MSDWKNVCASVIGNDHIRREMPCQDASLSTENPRLAGIVCDGAGSAARSHDGAAAAVREFGIFVAGMNPMFAEALDDTEKPVEVAGGLWRHAAECLCSTICAAKAEAATCRGGTGRLEDYDFTMAAAVFGKAYVGLVQVGDGAIVARQGATLKVVFNPEKGRYCNQTVFVGWDVVGQESFRTLVVPVDGLDGLMLMSDGPQPLMVDLNSYVPGEVVSRMFDRVADGQAGRAEIIGYLSDARWFKDPRGGDDKSLVVFARHVEEDAKPTFCWTRRMKGKEGRHGSRKRK